MARVEQEVWGPVVVGGRRSSARRALFVLVVATVLVAMGVAIVNAALERVAEDNLTRVELPTLVKTEPGQPMNVLIVGSDSREGLTQEELEEYALGDFGGARGDTVILVAIPADRQNVSVLSFPRDLAVMDGDRRRKLTDTFARGADHVVEVLQATTGIPIHHYVEVSIPGFLGAVEAVGGVELCLDEPLHDWRSGAAFDEGCHDMGPREALAYVRSRQGERGDFERMERQQQFLQAAIAKMASTRTLIDLPRLFRVVEEVAQSVTTDSEFAVSDMRGLARELRSVADGTIPMTHVPGYTATIDGLSYVIAYEPGAQALYADIVEGRTLQTRGSREDRAATLVEVWTGGRGTAGSRVQGTLFWAGFPIGSVRGGPVDAGERTVVFAREGFEQHAAWVAATLGVEVQPLPNDVEAAEGSVVVVAVGDDAAY